MEMVHIFPKVITLNVGGNVFTTSLSTLQKDSDSMLAAMFSGRHEVATDAKSRYFIDRDGTYFGYIIEYLRDGIKLPPPALALKVYHEAEYYQIEGLRKALEIFPEVFIAKLDRLRTNQFHVHHWKSQLVEQSQRKCKETLSCTSKVYFMSLEDHKRATEDVICTRGCHDPFIIRQLKESKEKTKSHSESFEYVNKKIRQVEIIVTNVKQQDMKTFVLILENHMRKEGYKAEITEDTVKCKNYEMIYGYGKEECKFNIHYYVIEFNWSN